MSYFQPPPDVNTTVFISNPVVILFNCPIKCLSIIRVSSTSVVGSVFFILSLFLFVHWLSSFVLSVWCTYLVYPLAGCSKFPQQLRQPLRWELLLLKAGTLLALARLQGKKGSVFRSSGFLRRPFTDLLFHEKIIHPLFNLFFLLHLSFLFCLLLLLILRDLIHCTANVTSIPGGLAPHPRKPAEPFPGA